MDNPFRFRFRFRVLTVTDDGDLLFRCKVLLLIICCCWRRPVSVMDGLFYSVRVCVCVCVERERERERERQTDRQIKQRDCGWVEREERGVSIAKTKKSQSNDLCFDNGFFGSLSVCN